MRLGIAAISCHPTNEVEVTVVFKLAWATVADTHDHKKESGSPKDPF